MPRPDENPASAADPSLKARLYWLRARRDHKLAALCETYMPRLRALHDELSARRGEVWAEYDREVERLRAA